MYMYINIPGSSVHFNGTRFRCNNIDGNTFYYVITPPPRKQIILKAAFNQPIPALCKRLGLS